MKRELAFALKVQAQCGSIGRTRSGRTQIPTENGAVDCSGVSGGESNVKPRTFLNDESEGNDSCDHIEEAKSRRGGIIRYSRSKRQKHLEEPQIDEGRGEQKSDGNDSVVMVEEKHTCGGDLVAPVGEEEMKSPLQEVLIKDEYKDGSPESIDGSKEIDIEIKEILPKRFTRSALKLKVDTVNSLEADSKFCNSAAMEFDEKTNSALRSLTSPKKLELKMSKKIALSNVPGTLRELLETGMLEGYPVTYDGRKKAFRLQGTIKDNGILCSCSLCKGCRVVLPSQFELHACKAYRNAAKYIYLDNGKSLYDVLQVCKDAPLETLEATIQSAIGSSPVKWSSPAAAETSKKEPLSNSCIKEKKSLATSTCRTSERARSSKTVPVTESPGNPFYNSSEKKSQWKITKKDQRLHRLVFEEGGLPDGTEVAYFAGGKRLLEGYKKGFGIFCRCCNCVVSASQFEAHAGWASRKKPYSYIYTSNGVSLHELAVSLSRQRKFSNRDNDNLCSICGDGGSLLLCDGCPRAFHRVCASLPSIPRDDWYCRYCQNMLQREKSVASNVNAVAAGRVSGVDPIEQITKRCIRIVNPEAEVSACVLCRGFDFSKSGFGARTIILCDQCEKEFHIGCLRDHKMQDLKELPEGKWFCCLQCVRIHSALQKLLVRGEETLPDSLLNVIKTKHENKGLDSTTDYNVKWRLLSGKLASSESKVLLSEAVAIFHDCFDPIIDSVSGRDLIPAMVYGRNVRGQDFSGLYCVVLTVNSHVVSAGILRVFGQEVAELPLVATSADNQGKGYFQTLFSCIEKLLAFLNVRSFVLPAAEEAKCIWTEKFGFAKIAPEQLCEYRKSFYQMISFQGTSMLQKELPGCRIIQQR